MFSTYRQAVTAAAVAITRAREVGDSDELWDEAERLENLARSYGSDALDIDPRDTSESIARAYRAHEESNRLAER